MKAASIITKNTRYQMKDLIVYKDGFCISTEKTKLDLETIHQFLSTQAYWCRNIPFSIVEKAARHSLTFGLYYNDQQIGYARIISDFSTMAYLADLFVLPAFRGQGLSKWLMQTIMNHPELQGLRRWILLTGDAHELYKQFGWAAPANPEKWMEVHNKEVYSK